MPHRTYSTAEALAQFALELDTQRQTGPDGNDQAVPVFTTETRDRLVIEAARVLVTDGLNIRPEPPN